MEKQRTVWGPPLEFDFSAPRSVRAYLQCPETGKRREIAFVELMDGGRIEFPRDFSSNADPESIREALPIFAPGKIGRAHV